MQEIKPIKIGKETVAFDLFGRGEKIGFYALIIFTNKEPDQIKEKDYLTNADGELILYYDTGNPGISHPSWRGTCFIDPQYDSKEFREKLIDHLLDQKIVERPVLIGFTGWDRSGKVQGSVARYGDDGQDIFIGGD